MSLKKDKPESPKSAVDKYKAFLEIHLCTFRTAGRRCQILAAHMDDHGDKYGLCGWHWLNQSTPKLFQDYEEFVRYRNRDRQTYPKEWLQASLYVDDAIVWACILGKEQRREFVRALRVVENECEKEVFGKESLGPKDQSFDHPPTPEVSVQEYAERLPF